MPPPYTLLTRMTNLNLKADAGWSLGVLLLLLLLLYGMTALLNILKSRLLTSFCL